MEACFTEEISQGKGKAMKLLRRFDKWFHKTDDVIAGLIFGVVLFFIIFGFTVLFCSGLLHG
jgi:hypothetical protein